MKRSEPRQCAHALASRNLLANEFGQFAPVEQWYRPGARCGLRPAGRRVNQQRRRKPHRPELGEALGGRNVHGEVASELLTCATPPLLRAAFEPIFRGKTEYNY